MGQNFNNLGGLAKYLDQIVKQSLVSDVGNKVKQVMQEHIIDDVYDAYTPSAYERTGKLMREIQVNKISDGVEISPVREEDDVYIPAVIESGQGYTWVNSEIYRTKQKRPFVENTKDEIIKNNIHVESLKKGLRKAGLDVK